MSWENTWYGGPATKAAPAVAGAPTKKAKNPDVEKKPLKAGSQSATNPKKDNGSKTNSYTGSSGGHWKRTSYYNAKRRVADNVMFLGNYGGEGSGVFDK